MAHPVFTKSWAAARRTGLAAHAGWTLFRAKYRGKPVRMTVLLLLLALSGYLLYLDITIRDAFEGRKFALPDVV